MNSQGTAYVFTRDRFTGEGNWVVVKGQGLGLLGYNNAGSIVPLIFQTQLTKEAKERGLSEVHNFSRNKPKPPPPVKRPKGPKAPRARRTRGIKGPGIKLSLGR
jgi:hypothetical protein